MKNQAKIYANRLNYLRCIVMNGANLYALKNLSTVDVNSIVVYNMEGYQGIAPLGALLASSALPSSYSVIAVPDEDNKQKYKISHELHEMLENSEWGAQNFSALFDSAYKAALDAASGPMIDFDKPLYNAFGEVKLHRKDGVKDESGIAVVSFKIDGHKITYPVARETGEPVVLGMDADFYSISNTPNGNKQREDSSETIGENGARGGESLLEVEIPSFIKNFLKKNNIDVGDVVVVNMDQLK